MTLGELRKFILEAGGKIKIGEVKIIHNGGGDIDVSINSSLVSWIDSGISSETNLEDVRASTGDDFNTGLHRTLKSEISEKDDLIIKLETGLKEAQSQAEKNQLAVGKVEAYEKLLIGRSVSIGA